MDWRANPGGVSGGPRGFGWSPPSGGVFGRARGVYTHWRGSPSWAQRTSAVLALLVLVGIAAVLLVLGLTVGAVIAVIVGTVLAVRGGWSRLVGAFRGQTQRDRGGEAMPLDPLRENVRVVTRQSDGTGTG